ncbi:zinc finger CCHC domain-containing protein 3 isoform X2 [Betta splendens]|uniref:Zinc finger CCHC domain-containing protein 3 isoform X2 n=1 Tax=Betta splendens TaxID=158456 RepID=A0A6P7MLF6_BETSP|nr:zinc finger CCHC domain-containing protein 3 isoform X2 [Betta splendens]
MATGQAFPRVGLRHTLRFQWKEVSGEVMPRDVFCKKIIKELLSLKVVDVYCLQWHPQARAYDLTLASAAVHQTVADSCRRLANTGQLGFFDVISLDRPNFRVITIHMFNPFVTDMAIKDFLGRFADVLSSARYVKDSCGFWTGRRQFQVLLHEDREGHDGFRHPPAYFQLGADRGYLYYARQPIFCRKCRRHGHVEAECTRVTCRYCERDGHVMEACPFGKICNACGEPGHLYRNCPKKQRSFADVVGGDLSRTTGDCNVQQDREEVGESEINLLAISAGERSVDDAASGVSGVGAVPSDATPRVAVDVTVQATTRKGRRGPDTTAQEQCGMESEQQVVKKAKGSGVPEVAGPQVDDTSEVPNTKEGSAMLTLSSPHGVGKEETEERRGSAGSTTCSWAEQMDDMDVYGAQGSSELGT